MKIGQKVDVVVKCIDRKQGKVILSYKETLGSWEDNIKNFTTGTKVKGIVRETEEFDAVVKLSDGQGYYEKEKHWPDNVKIEREDNHWLYKVRTCGAYWLKRWVMSLGREAELLEPEWLRNEIRCEMENIAASYQK